MNGYAPRGAPHECTVVRRAAVGGALQDARARQQGPGSRHARPGQAQEGTDGHTGPARRNVGEYSCRSGHTVNMQAVATCIASPPPKVGIPPKCTGSALGSQSRELSARRELTVPGVSVKALHVVDVEGKNN